MTFLEALKGHYDRRKKSENPFDHPRPSGKGRGEIKPSEWDPPRNLIVPAGSSPKGKKKRGGGRQALP